MTVTIKLELTLDQLIEMKNQTILQEIKKTIEEIEPTAQIFLYGSRARNDAKPDSDWDIMILLDGQVNFHRSDRLRHRIYEIEWETDEIICSIIRSSQEWYSPKLKQTPFYQLVTKDAILL